MFKRKSKKAIMGVMLILMLLGTGVMCYAATIGTFTFEFHTAVNGTKVFNLSAKNTTVKTTGTTYSLATNAVTTSKNYCVALPKQYGFASYSSPVSANGTTKSINMGTVSAGKYNVNLQVAVRQPSGAMTYYIKGTGSVNQ